MQKIFIVGCLIVLTIVAFIVNNEIFGLLTIGAWAAAFCGKLFAAHEEYRSYRANN